MFKSYLKIAWRNLRKNKVYSTINILGLAAGMTVAMLIAFWIWDEVTFDHYHSRHKRIAQVMTTYFDNHDAITATYSAVSMPLGTELKNKFGSDFTNVAMGSWNFDHAVAIGEKKIATSGMWVDSNFPSMFTFKMLKGDINALSDPSSVLINASLAKALFGDEDPVNKIVKLDTKDDYKVAGVFEDFPQNTTLYDAKIFLPWKKFLTMPWLKDNATKWNDHSFQAFVELADHVEFDKASQKIKDIAMAHKNAMTEGKEESVLFAMDKWRLYSEFKNGKPSGGRIQFVWLFAIIGIFVLLLASINFMNLSTARSEKRAKEVGIRKTVGSARGQLIGQFLSESVLVALVSFIFSIVFVLLLMPMFDKLADKNILLPWTSVLFWSAALTFTLVTGLISGSYPALYLSGFEPIKVLKGTFRVGKFASLPRKILVVIQFSFSIALIIGTIIVFKQIQYAKDRPVNYSNEGLITVMMGSAPGLFAHYDAIRADLLATGAVEDVAESSSPTSYVSTHRSGFNWEGKDPNTLPGFGYIYVTENFGKTVRWKIKEGRDFSKEFATDSLAMILNEAAVKQIAMKKDIVGQTIQYDNKNFHVIGVIKDMVMESPYKPVEPIIFVNSLNDSYIMTIAIKTGSPIISSIDKIQSALRKYNSGALVDYTFNDENFARKFSDEERVGNLATFFTILAIFISCLGLFGLASFVAEQRKKEIGLRKVLGASTYSLWRLLSKEFAFLVLISCFIAIPLAWYYLHHWLQQYDYRTTISSWVFVVSGFGALLITLFTVSFQAIKAALANPVKSLRTE